MKLIFAIVALIIVSASAFVAPMGARHARNTVVMQATKPSKIAAALISGAFLTFGAPHASIAANYGGFGSTYAEVLDPKEATLSETGVTDDVKSGYSSIQNYIKIVQSAKADLTKDSDAELYERMKKDLVPSVVRSSLNKFNTAFSEDSQRGTDRLIRLVLQGLTELDRETQVKPGKARAEIKTAIIMKRLTATEDALTQLGAFMPK